ncbi:biotin transporter BioY [Gryllotalpicola sp.]|uniref:biotin transporter BioY n=1 Tax=Gryllotalpicola sp. TaxID=1932787 RepID=UPI002623E0AB|nr:biotin transporter BioY [Gryllotalpicola sp.]
MSVTPSLTARSTIADRFVPRSLAADAALIVGGAVLTALLAQVSIPMWPVWITGQTLAVLLVGATLGAVRGAISMGLYLVAGLIGVPVFTNWGSGFDTVTTPQFGYIIGFIASAALMGFFAQRGWDRSPLKAVAAFVLADAIIYPFGLAFLLLTLSRLGANPDFATVLRLGLVPFFVGDGIKIVIAAAALPLAWRLRR